MDRHFTRVRAASTLLAMAFALAMAIGPAVATVRASTATSTTLAVPAGIQYGPVQVTARVVPVPTPTNGFLPGVSFLSDGNLVGASPLDDTGVGTSTLPLGPGTHTVVATFGPVGDFDASQSAPATVTVGIATQVTLVSSPNPALTTQAVAITASVTPHDVAGGTLTIVDAFDGSTIATGPIGNGSWSVSVSRTLAAGQHDLTASFSGDADFGPSAARLAQVVTTDTGVDATGVRVDYATFYPYKDGYRDTEFIRGSLRESASVVIRIYGPTNKLLRTVDLGRRAPGAYVYGWTGRTAAGTPFAAGTYRVVQRLTDTAGNVLTATSKVAVSAKRLHWHSATITLAGGRYDAVGDPGNGSVSRAASPYGGGVRLSSGTAGVAVRYPFTLHSAVAYGSTITFKVTGRSPNGHRAVAGLWNRALCSPLDIGCYDVKAIGPKSATWSISASSGLHRNGRRAYGVVIVPYLGGRAIFDVAKVQLVYRWAVLA